MMMQIRRLRIKVFCPHIRGIRIRIRNPHYMRLLTPLEAGRPKMAVATRYGEGGF